MKKGKRTVKKKKPTKAANKISAAIDRLMNISKAGFIVDEKVREVDETDAGSVRKALLEEPKTIEEAIELPKRDVEGMISSTRIATENIDGRAGYSEGTYMKIAEYSTFSATQTFGYDIEDIEMRLSQAGFLNLNISLPDQKARVEEGLRSIFANPEQIIIYTDRLITRKREKTSYLGRIE